MGYEALEENIWSDINYSLYIIETIKILSNWIITLQIKIVIYFNSKVSEICLDNLIGGVISLMGIDIHLRGQHPLLISNFVM